MKPRLPPSRSLQVSNPGPNGFVLLGSPSASASWWKLRLPKRRSTGIILVALLVLCGSIAAFYLRREPTEIERLERAAYRGDTKAQVQLFSHYTAGLGVPKDEARGYAWLTIAGALDQKLHFYDLEKRISPTIRLEGQRIAAELFKKVQHSPKPDPQKQTLEETRAKEKPLLSTASPVQPTPAPLTEIAQLRAKAEQGDATAQNDLGFAYAKGQKVPKDEAEAVRWFRKAASQGCASAQYNLGIDYAIGQGVPKDVAEAVKWYRMAADQGYASAQYMLGLVFEVGEGVPMDRAKATEWHQKAAAQGYALAQSRLKTLKPDDVKLRHLATDDRLPTGSLLVDRLRNDGGKGKLTLDNGRAEDAYVKLVRDGKTVTGFYVRSHEKVTYSTIPDGSFWVMYCTGYGWDAKVRSFARGRYARHYDLPLTYTTRQERDASGITTSTDVVTLTLHTVANGNTTTTEMSVEDFDRY